VLVIGITGRNCAGKDTLADLLEARGFERHSLSDAIRAELRSRGQEITRDALIRLGRELREAEGPAVLAERMKRMIETDRVALVSVRSPAEIESLRQLDRFVLVSVAAPVDVRYERELARGREGAGGTLEDFVAIEEREDSTDPNAQQLSAAIAMADTEIQNDGDRAALAKCVEALLGEIDV
jgi:dephospho-CoA kinase